MRPTVSEGRLTGRRLAVALLVLAAPLVVTLLPGTAPAGAATSCLAGTGTSRDPFLVASAADLGKVGSGTDGCTPGAHYLQTADIVLAAPVAPATSNHTPIGSLGGAFTGSYDGGGHTIDGLVIDLPTTDDVGLFSRANGATFRRIALTRADVTGRDDTAMLVGQAGSSTVIDSSASGTVTATGEFTGGLIGYAPSSFVLRSWTSGSVSGSGDETGGLVGYLPFGGVRSSYSTADVASSGTSLRNVGGLVGYLPGLTSEKLRIAGSATATSTEGTSIVTGDVFRWTLTLDMTQATTGGDTFADSVADFDLVAAPGNVGDWSPDTIVWATSPAKAVVGYHSTDQVVIQLAATSGAPDIDGVSFGDLDMAIFWDPSDLDAQPSAADLEAFLGSRRPPLESAQMTFQLRGDDYIADPPTVVTFAATIEVDHPQEDDLVDVFARGDVTVTAGSASDVAGLVGYIPSTTVARVLSTGAVTVTGTGTDVGGLIGFDGSDSFTEGYWDTGTSGLTTSAAGAGRTTAQLTSSATFATWPIVAGWAPYDVAADRVWGICPRVNDGYPFLLWRYDSDPCATPAAATSLTVACTGPDGAGLVAGAAASCTLRGADPDVEFVWRAANNPTFAEGVVRAGTDGTGTFGFTVPRAAGGDTITVEIVAWTAPIPVGTAAPAVGGPVPRVVNAGDGVSRGPLPVPGGGAPSALVVLVASLLLLRAAPRRRRAAQD